MGVAEPLVSLRGIGKSFANGVAALENFDLDLRDGEFLTLLGPSGCGKSTALRLISGLATPSAGAILWREPQAAHNIGFVFQEATLLPWADVFANVYLPLRLAGKTRATAAPLVRETLALVGLSDFETALPRQLSGGMKMRVAIARALVTRPRLLLMDEPFAALDEVTRFRLGDDLLAMKQRLETTIVFVTHSIYESVYLSTRILALSARGGAIVDTIDIDATIARDEEFRASPQFAQFCRRASTALRSAYGEGLR
ncbi:ABC transporter ATP-binding protein [Methylosinus sp. H3A]|uniref:ABC transporter ATP-binding protein n=1 Tax=Methylosinus sp. H3A TaxID=2785786 RepID=UPI0018C30130|nr:ABC transporter ATP-binding protein [Methylosinus sp. H3A]MBG0810323.1 ABC transporter ATP-binding protein [Methylosinus sp. H3A]